jgi:hypothetical protein
VVVLGLCTAAGFARRTIQHAMEWQTVYALVKTGLGISLVTRLQVTIGQDPPDSPPRSGR